MTERLEHGAHHKIRPLHYLQMTQPIENCKEDVHENPFMGGEIARISFFEIEPAKANPKPVVQKR